MSVPFARTLRALEAEGGRYRAASFALFVLVGAWAAWAALAQVPLNEVTETARLEVDCAAHPITAVVGGRVVEKKLRLGQDVRAGEIVLILDAETEQRALQEKQTRHRALVAGLTALRQEIEVEKDALHVQQQAGQAALEEARAQVAEAEIRARFAEHQYQTSTRLKEKNAVSVDDLLRDQTEAQARATAARALRLGVDRLTQDRAVLKAERQVRQARLKRDAVELEGKIAVEAAGILRLEHDITLFTVRAPVDGRVGEVGAFPVGTVVRAAEKLGSIVPPGSARAVALFPAAVVGRIRPGQPARLRLHGYPWTDYGTLTATVACVGNEPSDGRVRVELSLEPHQNTAIPLQHGLPGTAEVEIERVAPVVLALRAAGQLLHNRHAAGGSEGVPQ